MLSSDPLLEYAVDHMLPGTNYKVRTLHQTVDAPSLQYTDAIGSQLGQRFTNLQLSGSLSGPITYDKAFYNLSYQLGRMKDGVVFKRDGVMTPEKFFHSGPVNGWRLR